MIYYFNICMHNYVLIYNYVFFLLCLCKLQTKIKLIKILLIRSIFAQHRTRTHVLNNQIALVMVFKHFYLFSTIFTSRLSMFINWNFSSLSLYLITWDFSLPFCQMNFLSYKFKDLNVFF